MVRASQPSLRTSGIGTTGALGNRAGPAGLHGTVIPVRGEVLGGCRCARPGVPDPCQNLTSLLARASPLVLGDPR